MRARRVALLLAIAAISALTLFVISLLVPDAAVAAPGGTMTVTAIPDTLLGYEENVIVGPDGDARVEISVVVDRGGLGDLLLPFEFNDGEDFTVLSGPAAYRVGESGLVQPTVTVLGRRFLNLRLQDAAHGDTVRVAATVPRWFAAEESRRPYGEYVLERSFVNVSPYVLRDFRLGVTLPPGMVVHSIEKVVPGFDPKQSPKPPYAVGRAHDRVQATLSQPVLPPAAAVRLDLNIRPARRGWIPLVAGAVLALLYLVFFRDVLKPKEME